MTALGLSLSFMTFMLLRNSHEYCRMFLNFVLSDFFYHEQIEVMNLRDDITKSWSPFNELFQETDDINMIYY